MKLIELSKIAREEKAILYEDLDKDYILHRKETVGINLNVKNRFKLFNKLDLLKKFKIKVKNNIKRIIIFERT